VRKVDQAQDAVDHRIAKGNERVNGPDIQSVDELLNEGIHLCETLRRL
jgi:hypothetical protein